MADVNYVITLGIGTPGDIPHLILVGLSPTGVVAAAATSIVSLVGIYQATVTVFGTHHPTPAVIGRYMPTVPVVGHAQE